jgi:hypothetical protein
MGNSLICINTINFIPTEGNVIYDHNITYDVSG